MDELFTFGCLRHHCTLGGTPKFVVQRVGATITTYRVDMSDMSCSGSQMTFRDDDPEGKKCEDSWKVGRG
jgi:hypothetical protein